MKNKDAASFEKQDTYSGIGTTHWWINGRRQIALKTLSKYLPSRCFSLLDAGCGPGLLLRDLKSNYLFSYFGIDYSFYGLQLIEDAGAMAHFFSGDLTSLPLQDNLFDVIVAMDVLEHISDDQKALDELYRVLKPEGVVLFLVPAFQCLWGHHDEKYGHKRRYKTGRLRRLLSNSGFSIVTLDYLQQLFFIPLFVFRWIKNISGNRSDDFSAVNPIINSLLLKVVLFDYDCISRLHLSFGCNIIGVARKCR